MSRDTDCRPPCSERDFCDIPEICIPFICTHRFNQYLNLNPIAPVFIEFRARARDSRSRRTGIRALVHETALITAKFAETIASQGTDSARDRARLRGNFCPLQIGHDNFFPLAAAAAVAAAAAFIYMSGPHDTPRTPTANESDNKLRGPSGGIYGWLCGGMKSSIFLPNPRVQNSKRRL